MKKIILLIIFTPFLLSSYGQKFKTTTGKEFKNKSIVIDFVDIGRGQYLSYNYKSASMVNGITISRPKNYLIKLDNQMNKINQKEFEPIINGKLLEIERIFSIGTDIYALLSFYNKAKKKNYLFVAEIDRTTLKISENIKKIGEIRKASKDEIPGEYTFVNSENNKFSGIFVSDPVKKVKRKRKLFSKAPPVVQKKATFVNYIVIDREINVVNSGKKVSVSGTNEIQSELIQTIIDNSGNVLLLGSDTKYASKLREALFGTKIKHIEKTRFTVHKLGTNGSDSYYQTDASELDGDQVMMDVRLVMDNKNNRLHLVALKGDEINKAFGSVGVIKIELDQEDLEEVNFQFTDFNEEVMEKVNRTYKTTTKETKAVKSKKQVPISSKKTSKADKKMEEEFTNQGLTNLNRIANVTVDEAGNVFTALEHHWVTVVTTTHRDANGNVYTTTNYYYYYGNMAFLKFDDENEDVLQNAHNKYQLFVNMTMPDPATFSSDDGRFIILAQNEFLEIDEDLEKVKSKEFFTRKEQRRGASFNQTFFNNKMMTATTKSGKISYTIYEFL
jgi:hypothetical protein